jgi:hypothetical protein
MSNHAHAHKHAATPSLYTTQRIEVQDLDALVAESSRIEVLDVPRPSASEEEEISIEIDGSWDSLEAPQPVPAVVHFHLERATRLAELLAASVYDPRLSSEDRALALEAELAELEAVIGATYLDSVGLTLGALRRALIALFIPPQA